jgi:DNA-binding transcriptional MerR regulator
MNENFIDADFTDAEEGDMGTKDNLINGAPLFYTTSQVSKILNYPVSTIRLYTKRFSELLDLELSNKNNQYKKKDVEKLRFILKLTKVEGLTLQQAKDYCSRKGFNLDDIEKAVMESNTPLPLQTFITAMTMEIDKKLEILSDTLLNKIEEKQQKNNEYLQEIITGTVEDIVLEKLDLSVISQLKSQEELKKYIALTIENSLKTNSEDVKTAIDIMEQSNTKHILEKEELAKQHMEERKQYQKLLQDVISQQQNQSWWKRLFKKKIDIVEDVFPHLK